jgi:hypothetical protein
MSFWTDCKRVIVIALSLALVGLAACGGSSRPSGLSKRAFVSDNADGTLHIEDAQNDIESRATIATGAQPGVMALSPDKTITLVFNAGASTLSIVTNNTESVLGSIGLPGPSTSYVSLANDTVGFAAVSSSSTAPCTPRCVEILNLATTFDITATINSTSTTSSLSAATTLELSPDGNKLLVFGGPSEHVDTLTFIDTNAAQSAIPPPASAATQFGTSDCTNASLPANCFDRPVQAVYSTDSTRAYVFNCGAECAGGSASLTVMDMTKSPPVPIANVPLPGATTGLLSGSTLYVAGSPPTQAAGFCPSSAACGTLSVLNTASLTSGPTNSVPISNGFHSQMVLASNNKLFIAANPACAAGCLSIFDTSANQAAVDGITSNVTGMAPISNRSVVYVIEDVAAGSLDCPAVLPCRGKLRIYDTTASAPTLTPTQIDVVGEAVDVKYVDQ